MQDPAVVTPIGIITEAAGHVWGRGLELWV